MSDLSGKVAAVTGGGSGIGAAIAEAFAAAGATVCILDRNLVDAQKVADGIAAAGGQVQVSEVDIADQAACDACFANLPQLDILVNNAGIAAVGDVSTCDEAELDRVYAVNVKGVYNCLHTVVPQMAAQGHGAILNMSSIAALIGIKDRFAYSMSKGAVHAMTLSVAKDYVDKGIRCNSICPARVHTPFVDGFLAQNYPGNEQEMFNQLSAYQPIGRMGTPAEIAKLALFLCSDDAAFITGVAYPIDGGVTSLI